MSPQVEQLLGYPPERYLRDPSQWYRQVYADDVDRIAEEWRRAREQGDMFECEYRMVAADGRIVWIRDSALPIRDDRGETLFWQGVLYDVTEEKLHEEELRRAEQQYRALVENLPAIVYLVAPDDDRRTIYVSPQVERALGYSRQEWLDQPDIWMELLHPDDREPALAALDEHNRTGEPWSREYRLIAADGRAVWFRDVATLVRDADGTPLYWQGIQLDITELKDAEEQLRRAHAELERRVAERTAELEEANVLLSLEVAERRRAEAVLAEAERRYRLLTEQLPAVAYTWGVGEGLLEAYTSPRITDLLGYTVEEWHRDPDFWMSRLHPDDRRRIIAATLRSETTGKPFREEYRYLHKDGHIVWVHDEAVLVARHADGRPRLFQGFMLDITARKEAEAEAREAEERYRTLVEQLPAIVYVEEVGHSPDESRLRYVSPQVEAITGYTPEEMLGDPLHFERILHPDDRSRVLAASARSAETGEPFDEVYRILAKDGRVLWLHSRAVLVRDDVGRPRYWHGVTLDVTEQRATLQRLEALERRYADLAFQTFRTLGLHADQA
ncbi:Sensor protein FixL [bacterium HR12]|nr:Sensor protein FixL [bacterium HR12]